MPKKRVSKSSLWSVIRNYGGEKRKSDKFGFVLSRICKFKRKKGCEKNTNVKNVICIFIVMRIDWKVRRRKEKLLTIEMKIFKGRKVIKQEIYTGKILEVGWLKVKSLN